MRLVPGDRVRGLALRRVGLARLRVDRDGLVVLRDVVVVVQPDAVQLQILRLYLALVVAPTVQADGDVLKLFLSPSLMLRTRTIDLVCLGASRFGISENWRNKNLSKTWTIKAILYSQPQS